jgi:hypothetical protein
VPAHDGLAKVSPNDIRVASTAQCMDRAKVGVTWNISLVK